MTDEEVQAQFDDFFEDFFVELAKIGVVVEMHVCDNIGEHLIGNVYARYEWEEEAQRAVDALNDRWYNGESPFHIVVSVKLSLLCLISILVLGRPLFAELSPVTDFREACCRQHETNECQRGGFCNFMHVRHPNPRLVRSLNHEQAVEARERKRREREAKKEKSGGWKEEVSTEGGSDWKKGSSGGDWRSGSRRSQSPQRA